MKHSPPAVIEITGLKNKFDDQWVHYDINLTIYSGEIFAIIGSSGCGKTTLLRSLLMLMQPTAGIIRIFGHNITDLNDTEIKALRQRFGVLFQHSALFSAMTVLENVCFPMHELTSLHADFVRELALLKLSLVGLSGAAAYKFPAELSGGMQRRAAAARAISMDPELLFLDEPTSGLDPLSAKQFDQLIVFLRNALNLTIVIVSHDIDSLKRTCDRVAFLGDGKVLAVAPIEELIQNPHPLIVEYFSQREVAV